jgi:hypothetical protein
MLPVAVPDCGCLAIVALEKRQPGEPHHGQPPPAPLLRILTYELVVERASRGGVAALLVRVGGEVEGARPIACAALPRGGEFAVDPGGLLGSSLAAECARAQLASGAVVAERFKHVQRLVVHLPSNERAV